MNRPELSRRRLPGTPTARHMGMAVSNYAEKSSTQQSTPQHHESNCHDEPKRDVAPSRAARFGLADFMDRRLGQFETVFSHAFELVADVFAAQKHRRQIAGESPERRGGAAGILQFSH